MMSVHTSAALVVDFSKSCSISLPSFVTGGSVIMDSDYCMNYFFIETGDRKVDTEGLGLRFSGFIFTLLWIICGMLELEL